MIEEVYFVAKLPNLSMAVGERFYLDGLDAQEKAHQMSQAFEDPGRYKVYRVKVEVIEKPV